MNKFKLPLFSLVQRIEKGTNLQYLRQLDSCFGNGAKRISRNSIFVSGMERSGFPETLYLFREWSEADFPKLYICFGNGAKRISRNSYVILVSGNRTSFPKQ